MNKKVIFGVLMLVFATVTAIAEEPSTIKVVVINQRNTGVFKVIYQAEQASDVKLTIYNVNGTIVYQERVSETNGFSRPVNFKGMRHGVYTIEVVDNQSQRVHRIEYANESIVKNVHVARINETGKYLVAAADQHGEEVNVKIYDGMSNLVHNQNVVLTGNYAMVYNLKGVKGTPTFEVTDNTGNVKTVKY